MSKRQTSLGVLIERLEGSVEAVAMRGTGRSQFIYAVSGNRAVEVSVDAGGDYWVEYWEGDLEEASPSSEERTFPGLKEVEESVVHWLGPPRRKVPGE